MTDKHQTLTHLRGRVENIGQVSIFTAFSGGAYLASYFWDVNRWMHPDYQAIIGVALFGIMVMAMATLPWRVAYWLYPTSLDDK